MKETKRRLIIIALMIAFSIILWLCISPKVYAATTSDGKFEYTVNQSAANQTQYVVIEKYLGNESIVDIPETIEQVPVGVISATAFSGATCTQININSNIYNIGKEAFNECEKLQKIVVNENNNNFTNINQDGVLYSKDKTSIISYPRDKKDTTFVIPSSVYHLSTSSNRNNVFYKNPNLKEVTVSQNINEIGMWAFVECDNLEKVTISEGVTKIGVQAFLKLPKLTELNFSNTVKSIQVNAFYECTGLKTVTLPNSLENISGGIFIDCSNLSSIIVDQSNPNYLSDHGVLYNKAGTKIVRIPANLDIMNTGFLGTVTEIGEYAFEGAKIRSITIPNEITEIGKKAFQSCKLLEYIQLPNYITTIPVDLFYNCTSLKELIIPGNVTKISNNNFTENADLEYLIIPKTVTEIGTLTMGNSNILLITTTNSVAHQYATSNNIEVYLDDDAPVLQNPEYTVSQDKVIVTITANEALQTLVNDNREWDYVDGTSGCAIYAEFTQTATNEQLRIRDLVGNESTVTINTSNIDTTAPTVQLLKSDKTQYNNGDNVTITATFSEEIQEGTPKISMTGVTELSATDMNKKSATEYTYSYRIDPDLTTGGTQEVTVTGAKDLAGNLMSGQASTTFSITVVNNDQEPPTVTDISTGSKKVYNPGESFTITAKFSEEIQEGTPKISMSGVSNLNSSPMNRKNATEYTYNYTVPTDITTSGTQTITISDARDKAGNIMVNPTTSTFQIQVNSESQTISVDVGTIYTIRTVSGKDYITNIQPNTTFEQLFSTVKTNGTNSVFSGSTKITDTKQKVATGMKIKVELGSQSKEYIFVVKGDVNGDTSADVQDIMSMNRHRLSKGTPLSGEKLLAGDVNGDNVVDLNDIFQVNKFRLGRITQL